MGEPSSSEEASSVMSDSKTLIHIGTSSEGANLALKSARSGRSFCHPFATPTQRIAGCAATVSMSPGAMAMRSV